MANTTKLNFEVGFDIDKNSYDRLMDSLDKVMASANNPRKTGNKTLDKQLQDAGKAAKDLQTIMESS